jgi:hypothetical protein
MRNKRPVGGDFQHSVDPVCSPLVVAPPLGYSDNHTPKIIQQCQPQHDRDCPQLAES